MTNLGPVSAYNVLAAIQLPPGVTLVNAGGGLPAQNRSVLFGRPSLSATQSATYTVTVRTTASVRGTGSFVGAAASYVNTDSNTANNTTTAPITIVAP